MCFVFEKEMSLSAQKQDNEPNQIQMQQSYSIGRNFH